MIVAQRIANVAMCLLPIFTTAVYSSTTFSVQINNSVTTSGLIASAGYAASFVMSSYDKAAYVTASGPILVAQFAMVGC